MKVSLLWVVKQANIVVKFTSADPVYKYDFENRKIYLSSKPPDWILCKICQGLAAKPIQASCCGNVYCNKCIEAWRETSDTCPKCKSTPNSEPKFALFSDENVRRHISSLVVLCSNVAEGCTERMELSQLEQHLSSECKFRYVDCSYGCGEKLILHKDLQLHEEKSMAVHLKMTFAKVAALEEKNIKLEEKMKRVLEHLHL